MSDKEKTLIAIIIVILTGVISYRIEFIDDKIQTLELRLNQSEHINKGR